MRRAQVGEDDQLRKQFHHLQQDWNSYKQSVPRRSRHCRSSSASTSADATTPVPELLRLLHNSPKKLISSLQDSSRTPSARPRPVASHDAATAERKSAIESGKLRGRSLLEALESAKDEAGPHGREDICSICSSVLIQEAEAVNSSSCSCCSSSSVDRHKRDRNARYVFSSSNSSSSSYIEASLENNNNNNNNNNKVVRDEEVVASERNEIKNIRINSSSSSNNNNNNNSNANGEKWVVRVGWFALALVVLAFGLISYVEFGVEESVEYMIPT